MLLEDIHFDPESGQLLTGSFMDYAMPRALDFPSVHCTSNPVPTKSNPLGVKGAGEAGAVGAMPAVGNALIDALAPLGIRDMPMPATRNACGVQSRRPAVSLHGQYSEENRRHPRRRRALGAVLVALVDAAEPAPGCAAFGPVARLVGRGVAAARGAIPPGAGGSSQNHRQRVVRSPFLHPWHFRFSVCRRYRQRQPACRLRYSLLQSDEEPA